MIQVYAGMDGLTPAEMETLKAVAKRAGYSASKVLKAPAQLLKVKSEGVLIGFQVLPRNVDNYVAGGEFVSELCWATAATGELPASWRRALDRVEEEATRLVTTSA